MASQRVWGAGPALRAQMVLEFEGAFLKELFPDAAAKKSIRVPAPPSY